MRQYTVHLVAIACLALARFCHAVDDPSAAVIRGVLYRHQTAEVRTRLDVPRQQTGVADDLDLQGEPGDVSA